MIMKTGKWLKTTLVMILLSLCCGFTAASQNTSAYLLPEETLKLLSRSSTKPIDELITTAYPQEELIEYLFKNCEDMNDIRELFINLSPYYKNEENVRNID